MRELEFRAWFADDENVYKFTLLDAGDYCLDEAYCIEQYTGRKDKDNIKIFESDIVQVSGHYWINGDIHDGMSSESFDCTFIGVVSYQPSKGFVLLRTIRIDSETEEIERIGRMGGFSACDTIVIGNIHENADLLK